MRGGRGGAAPKPVPIKASEAGTSIRGAAASRGRGNGPAVLAVAGGAKRKRELHASTDDAKPAPKPATTKKSRAETKNAHDTKLPHMYHATELPSTPAHQGRDKGFLQLHHAVQQDVLVMRSRPCRIARLIRRQGVRVQPNDAHPCFKHTMHIA